MTNSQVTLDRERTGRLAGLGVRFFLSAALTAGQTAGGSAPFALGWMTAAGPGLEGIAALAGAFAGAVLFLPFAKALPFLAVAVLIAAASTALGGTWLLSRPQNAAGTAVGLFITVEGIYILQSLSPLDRLADCLAAAGLLGASAWLFYPLLRGGEGREVVNGLLFLAGALVTAVEDLELLGFSPARALLCFLALLAAYDRGPAGGAAFGLGLGLTAELCGSRLPLTAALGLAGLAAGSLQGRRRTGAALAFLAAAGAAALAEGRPLPLLAEAAAGAALYLAVPRRFVAGKRVRPAIPPAPEKEPDGPAPWRRRLDRAAAALRDLYDSIGRGAPAADENPAIVFDRSAEKVCRGCSLCELCWQKDYTGTFNAMNDATPYLLERGRALPKDFPDYFTGRCIHLPDLLTAINGELSAFLLRRQYRRQLEETRRSAKGQYAQLSELLTATAAGLGAEAVTAAGDAAPCQIGAALRPREGESVCGDTVVSFRRRDGLWCLLLADGMGSGEAARKESALICRLLRQFLEAGVEPEAALKTLNSAMALRGAETGSFTTIDLCTCDPSTGETAFYKFGAAPSYLKKGGVVRRITGSTLPAGLRGTPASPDVTRVRLEPGGFAVMVSDGAADPGRDEWLQDLLAGWEGEDPQTLAGLILSESIRREHLQDDCAIQVLYRPREGGAKSV